MKMMIINRLFYNIYKHATEYVTNIDGTNLSYLLIWLQHGKVIVKNIAADTVLYVRLRNVFSHITSSPAFKSLDLR